MTIFVLPEYQGNGIGKQIIHTLEQDEFFLKAKIIEIPASITTVEFYRKMEYDYKNGGAELDDKQIYRLEKLDKFKFMKRYIANIITGSRVVFSLPLLFIPISSVWFYILYLFCGLTDMIDGTIARKVGAVSKFGARLDTVADFVFMFVGWGKISPLMYIPVWLWVWIIIIALIKIFNIALVFIYKKKLISIHSVLNKTTGLTLFLLPLSITFVETTYSVTTICVFATIAVMQEVYFIAKGKEVL